MKLRPGHVGDLDRLLHEPARLLLVALLYRLQEADFARLLSESELSRGNLSSHLARLEQAGYVAVEKRFRGKIPQTVVRLTEEGITAFESYRASLKRLSARLG